MSWAESVHRIVGGVRRRLRRWWLAQRGVRVGRDCWIQRVMVPRNPWDIRLGEGVMLDQNVVLLSTGDQIGHPRIQLRRQVYVNRFTVVDASERIEIGPHTMIGPHCYITDHDHGFEPDSLVKEQPMPSAPVTIGEDAWIGAGATILKGVSIGAQAVVGAGAVVTEDVEPGAKVAGVPGRRLGWRIAPANHSEQ
jgi:acetyltransferase-like isoleucine patch superfamily enzyme